MLKKDFNMLVLKHRDRTFNGFNQLIIDRRYGQSIKKEINTDRSFLQNEIIDFIEEANISKGPSKELLIPRCLTKDQVDSILSEILNQLL